MFLNYWYEEAVAQEMFCKKDILKNFAEFTRKHLNQLSFLIKLQMAQSDHWNFCTVMITDENELKKQ